MPQVNKRDLAALVTAFVVSRVAAFLLGVRPLTAETLSFMQFLDLGLLHDHLARVLLHLHSQPPLLNALMGLALKIGGRHYADLVTVAYMLLGLLAILCVYRGLTMLRVSSTLSLIVALVLLLNPSEILFEFDPLYTIPVVALHCSLVLAVITYQCRQSRWVVFTIVTLSVTLTLLRSSYQWIWIVAMFTILWLWMPQKRRQIGLAGGVALALSLLWPLKNEILFHHFISSTWGPLSLEKHWAWKDPKVQAYVQKGQLPTFARPGQSAEQLEKQLQGRWIGAPTGYPELDDLAKARGGEVNWNALRLLRLNDAKSHDIAFLIHNDPGTYVVSVLHAVASYFYPSSEYFVIGEYFGAPGGSDHTADEFAHNVAATAGIDTIVRRLCCNPAKVDLLAVRRSEGRVLMVGRRHTVSSVLEKLCLGAVLANGIVVLCGLSFGFRRLWLGAPERRIVAMVMTMTVAYAFTVVNLFEITENQRYRFETQALVFMVVAIFLQQIWDRRASIMGTMTTAKKQLDERVLVER
jgi:hypothetical protein